MSGPSAFFCDMTALTAEQRKRHAILADRVGASATARRELADGYSFAIDPKSVSLPEIREWIDLESRCCPFFRLGLSTEEVRWTLTIEGPQGVKPFIQAELPQFFER